jgi:hypothetical protein
MHDHPTPAARIAARSRRMRTAGIAGAVALLAGFSGLAAARMSHDGGGAATGAATAAPAASPSVATPSESQGQDDFFGGSSAGSVSPAAPSGAPDASSGAS